MRVLDRLRALRFALLAVLWVYTLAAVASDEKADPLQKKSGGKEREEAILKGSKPISEDYFPCSDCHEDEVPNLKQRKLVEEHDTLKLKHGKLWCFDCHDVLKRDHLHFADGELLGFEESWRLCVQCHGNKESDWRAGIHGKRTGRWRGEKYFETCVTCHNPHQPPFKKLRPEPRPVTPGEYDRGWKSRHKQEVR